MIEDELSSVSTTVCVVQIGKKGQHRNVGAAVLKRLARSGLEVVQGDAATEAAASSSAAATEKEFSIELFEFLDSEQLSSLDAFFVQLGTCVLYLSEEYKGEGAGGAAGSGVSKGDVKRVYNMLHGKTNLELKFAPKTMFMNNKKADLASTVLSLVGKATHVSNAAESQVPTAYACIEVLVQSLKLTRDEANLGCYDLRLGSLSNYMRLDSAAAEAVNLLPKPDHPSNFGSLYGVLNRCKTKMGSRLLERWLRQPLIDDVEINNRLDVVEMLKESNLFRNQLTDGPLKSSPDLDTVITKMQKKNAGLDEVWRLYLFTRKLPDLVTILTAMVDGADDELALKMATIKERFLVPFAAISNKFSLFQELVENVIDMGKLPDLIINPCHDPELQELHEEREENYAEAEKLLNEARTRWASFAEVKLESSTQFPFFMRATKQDDERQLRANKSTVRILSIQKNGVHFTTPELESVSNRCGDISREYERQQQGLVEKVVSTASTYLSVAEAASALVAELDVLTAFAVAAALSPSDYVRPTVLPRGGGVINLKAARHPCVELMDSVNFIANDYDLRRGTSSFQIVTGPNMGGKSTFIRGVGSIVTMAQVGSFVPCESAELSVVDAILARVGAGDAVQKGVSTFMAEMLEASVILQTATKDSLIIIDELGRGTSTFDGFGIAWAISDYMITRSESLCLFATHFHELTALSRQHACVVNKHVSAHIDENSAVTMLYNVADGPCSQSFGIHIAATADFPPEVIAEAKRKAQELEHVGTDMTSEVGRAKHQRVKESLAQFQAMDVPKMPHEQLVSQMKTVFPRYA